jgi:hypothetical protein
MTEAPDLQPQAQQPQRPRPAGPETMRPEEPKVIYFPAKGNAMATTALSLGIVATLFGLVPIGAFVAAVCAVLAIVFGFIGRRRANDPRAGGRSRATAGFVLGLVGLALSIIGMAIVTDGFLRFDESVDRIDRELQQEMRQFEEDYDTVAP